MGSSRAGDSRTAFMYNRQPDADAMHVAVESAHGEGGGD